MKRVALALSTYVAATLLAALAYAEPPQAPGEPREKSAIARAARPRYENTAERWRGRPYLPRAAAEAHPSDVTASEKVYQHLPSVNFMLEGQTGGAFYPHGFSGAVQAGF